MTKTGPRARRSGKAAGEHATDKAHAVVREKNTSHPTTARSAGGKVLNGRTAEFRGFGGANVALPRTKAGQPTTHSAPAVPPARPERGREDRPAALPGARDDRRAADPTADHALERFLAPEFYTAAADPAWIEEIAASDATVRMDLVRHGVPAQAVAALADALDLSRDELTRELGLPRSTVERKLRDGGHLGQAESERILGVARLISQVRRVVWESGNPTGFDAPLWVAHWLRTPVPALGGRPPMQFMDTAEGRAVVFQLVEQMQSGAYA
jgi:putative toxin-antitoxin system antitoxin component (TIGR02293 family)